MTNLASESYSAFETGGAKKIASFLGWQTSHRRLAPPVRVLDVGCGPGRMFGEFRSLGWQVTTMEPDPDFHEAAVAAAPAAGYSPPLRGGFLDVEAREAFDLVTAINGPFAYLLTPRDREEALRRVFRALRPGGVVLLDVPNFLWILKNYRAPDLMRAPTPGVVVHLRREHIIDYHEAVFTTVEHYDLVRDGVSRASSKTHAFAMTTLPELSHHLETAGFTTPETYASWAARAAERIDGARIIISAVRP